MVRQGDLYWIDEDVPEGSEPGYRRPFVVIQNNALNASGIKTVMTCPLTSNMRRANDRGNVLLDPQEGNLIKQSVVTVAQPVTFNRRELTEYIGRLSPSRVRQIVAGIRSCIEPAELDESGGG
jgi:mRNA interferase MazF